MSPATPRAGTALTLALAALLIGCAADTGAGPPPSPGTAPAAAARPRPVSYVAVGASDAFGFGASGRDRAWPYLFARSALPAGARVLDLGIPAVTTAQAGQLEAAAALAAEPDVVTVWLAVNDVLTDVTPADYESALDRLVARLRREGRTRVLVGTTPPLERLPAYLACRPHPPPVPRCVFWRRDATGSAVAPKDLRRTTDAYTAAVRRVAAREGATVVDLAAALQARGAGAEEALVASDGLHPSDAGHAALAAAFTAAYRSG